MQIRNHRNNFLKEAALSSDSSEGESEGEYTTETENENEGESPKVVESKFKPPQAEINSESEKFNSNFLKLFYR